MWKPPKATPMVATKEEAVAALLALRDSGAYDVADALRYVEATGIVPDWLNGYKPNVWMVKTGYRPYEVTAISEADARNKVRFRIYGTRPQGELPPMPAVCPHALVRDAVARVRGECVEHAKPTELPAVKTMQDIVRYRIARMMAARR